jgi:hypothetical protein
MIAKDLGYTYPNGSRHSQGLSYAKRIFWCQARVSPKAIPSYQKKNNNGVIKVSRFLFNWICSARRTCCCPPFVCDWKASSFSSQSSCWQEGMESFLVADVNDADEENMDLFNDDSSDEDSEASVTSELLIILRKGLRRPNYK